MQMAELIANDLFFSALGFFLGLWFWQLRCSRKGDR